MKNVQKQFPKKCDNNICVTWQTENWFYVEQTPINDFKVWWLEFWLTQKSKGVLLNQTTRVGFSKMSRVCVFDFFIITNILRLLLADQNLKNFFFLLFAALWLVFKRTLNNFSSKRWESVSLKRRNKNPQA